VSFGFTTDTGAAKAQQRFLIPPLVLLGEEVPATQGPGMMGALIDGHNGKGRSLSDFGWTYSADLSEDDNYMDRGFITYCYFLPYHRSLIANSS
jgi:hypothetical protein